LSTSGRPGAPHVSLLAPLLEALAEEHGLKLVKVSYDDEPDLADRFDVQAIPEHDPLQRWPPGRAGAWRTAEGGPGGGLRPDG
jgi:thiol-disulfide isomerase/thioredoxin